MGKPFAFLNGTFTLNHLTRLERYRFLPIILCLLLGVEAVARLSNVDTGDKAQVLHYSNGTEPEGVDPHIVTGVTENNIVVALFEGLVGIHPRTLEPLADSSAERWEMSPDGLTYTFYLRPEATWSNGDPVLASDYVYAYHRMLNPKMAAKYAYLLYLMYNAEAYNRGFLGRILVGEDPEFPVAWAALSSVDFRPNTSAQNPLNAKGLDALSLEELEALASGEANFDWPENLGPTVQTAILNRLLAYRRDPIDLWPKANVGVHADDDFILRIELEKPAPYFLGMLAHYSWYPVHPPTIEKHGGMTRRDSPWTRPENIVTNGAFVMKDWKINRHLHVVKREDYWDADKVRLQEIYFYPIDNVETEQRAFRDGYAHITSTVPTHRIEFNRKHYPNNQRFDAYLGVYYYRFNVSPPKEGDDAERQAIRKAMSDKRVRQALTYSIDRGAIVGFLGGGQLPAYSFVPPDTAGFNSRHKVPHNPQLARELLAEAGYPGGAGFPEILLLYNTSEGHKRIAEIIQQMWKDELGIEIRLMNQEWKVYLDSIARLEYDLGRAGWIGDYLDPSTFLDLWISSSGNNQTGFANSEYDRLIDLAARSFEHNERMEYFQQAERVLLDELPVLPIYYYVSSKLIRESVQGWYPNLLDRHPYKYVYLEPLE